MKRFTKYYMEAIGLAVYFTVMLPWALSQPSDLITIIGFVSIALVTWLIVYELYQLWKKKSEDL